MTEIKFRAWHKGFPKSKMLTATPAQMLYDKKPGDCLRWLAEGQPLEVMQFTGLFDKNGKEIYMGDIVDCFGIGKNVVAYHDGAFGYWIYEDQPFRQFISFAENKNFGWEDCRSERIEVIGNIYENPELLNPKN